MLIFEGRGVSAFSGKAVQFDTLNVLGYKTDALGSLYSVLREFGSLQKGRNTFFTSTKSLVKISTVEMAKPPIKSRVSWAIPFHCPLMAGTLGFEPRE